MTSAPKAAPCRSDGMAGAAAALVWETLLLNNQRIQFRTSVYPDVSIILMLSPASPRYAQNLLQLSLLLASDMIAVEIILVTEGDCPEAQRLLERLDGAVNVQHTDKNGGCTGRNRGAAAARGRFLLFLDAGIELMPGTLSALIAATRIYDGVGIVGARLVDCNGRLKEAGGFFCDDEALIAAYLGGEADASTPAGLHLREVAVVSGAVLMIETALFRALGGFDAAFEAERFAAADLCVRAIQYGRRVVYQPRAVAIDAELPSSLPPNTMEARECASRDMFRARHHKWLFGSGAQGKGILVRDVSKYRFRVLYIDDYTPHIDLGAGLPRANSIVNIMAKLGYLVTVLPHFSSDAIVADRYRDIDPRVEILQAGGHQALGRILDDRAQVYDALWVSRPHNIKMVVETFMERAIEPRSWVKGRVIFDTEAVFTCREAISRLTQGQAIHHGEISDAIADEVAFCSLADIVVCVSPSEDRILRHYGGQRSIRILGHALPMQPSPAPHAARSGVLFVGPLAAKGTPNTDSIEWFLAEIWPRVRRQLGTAAKFTLVGNIDAHIRPLFEQNGVEIIGRLDNLADVFNRHRVAIAPTRFAAGIPQKVHNAIAHGLPIVVTSLLAGQLSWQEGEGFLSATWQDPQAFADAIIRLHEDDSLWAAVRRDGLARVEADLSETAFGQQIRDLCEDPYAP